MKNQSLKIELSHHVVQLHHIVSRQPRAEIDRTGSISDRPRTISGSRKIGTRPIPPLSPRSTAYGELDDARPKTAVQSIDIID